MCNIPFAPGQIECISLTLSDLSKKQPVRKAKSAVPATGREKDSPELLGFEEGI
jgi:hypothetical protein